MTARPRRSRVGIDARKARDFGIGVYTRELLAALAANPASENFEFVVFARAADGDEFRRLPPHFRVVEANAAAYSVAELSVFPLALRSRRLDLFHALHYVVPPLAAPRIVVTIHDLFHLRFPEFFPGWRRRVYARSMFGRAARADRVIAVSQATAADLRERLGVSDAKIAVVPNGVSARFRADIPRSEAEAALRRHGLPKGAILFLGGGKPHKNAETLLRAFASYRGRGGAAALVLGGPMKTGERERLRARARDLGIGAAVHFPGVFPEEDLPAIYSGVRLLAHPALAEGFGLPILEAMACGTPVVTSNVSAMAEIAGAAAVTVDPTDVGALAGALERVERDEALRGELRRKGLDRSAEFRWERAAAATLNVYAEALRA
jgi:glycosyltransferase involved in cell wall biosynthesis